MEEYYGSNREYLQDCFQLVKMIERKANEASRGPVPATKKPEESDKPEQADPIEELRGRISRKAAESIRRKISIPLEELVKKHKLSEDERKILMILTYGESMCSTEYQDPKRMLNLLTLGKTEEAIKYWHYFKIDSGLYRKKIILMLPNDLAYRCYFIRIRPDKLLKILGEKSGKKPARKKTRQKLPSVSGPRQIYSGLNRYVVGQDYAKRMISVALYQHLKRIKLNEERKPADRIDKSNILNNRPHRRRQDIPLPDAREHAQAADRFLRRNPVHGKRVCWGGCRRDACQACEKRRKQHQDGGKGHRVY